MQQTLLKYCLVMVICASCNQKPSKLFTRLSEDKTGITFRNLLKEDNPEFNVVLYPYFYNGGGSAIGDINNDGLQDICFTGNMVKNRLFLNKGNMQFEDITEKAGIASKEGWCTGVNMVDINMDGKLDIYICRSGLKNIDYRTNLLFINNGDLSFTEKSADYGLNDTGYSTQSSFFDYDHDGDLDMFLINQSSPEFSIGKIEFVQLRKKPANALLSNKLFRNDNGRFVNVSDAAGIKSNVLTFSLGLSTADVNQDGWPDIYVANDFKEPDYLYINNRDGSFTDSLSTMISHSSLYSMGVDISDYNNDLLPDIAVLDMLPEGNAAQKMHMGADNFDQYNMLFNNGMFYQYMKNSLQKNNGNGSFSEIGQLAGMSNTDWSWSALFADLDNDGLKDLFVTNGYKRDNTDIEFMKYSYDQAVQMQQGGPPVSPAEYISHMPGIHIPNYIFHNKGNDQFENKAMEWGMEEKTFSHGASYADLDNDGDLDLVVNNTDEYAGIYRNNNESLSKNNYLKVKLIGEKMNAFGIGAKICIYAGKNKWMQEQNPVRGFQSAVDPVLHFGLAKFTMLDSLVVDWPNGKSQKIINLPVNKLLEVDIENANQNDAADLPVHTLLTEDVHILEFKHTENLFNDFTVQGLLPNYYSRAGPCMASGDINGDGKADIFIGGAKGQGSALYINNGEKFTRKASPAIEKDAGSEDLAALFFDADKDGDNDLYVGTGGYEFDKSDRHLIDHLYVNDGQGNFSKDSSALPAILQSTSCIKSADIDGDGDLDLFAGGRVVPGRYPESPESIILINNGKGKFKDGTNEVFAGLRKSGMITDALWIDLNKDKYPDLVTVGEWCAVKIYLNRNGKLEDVSATYIPFQSEGWWNKIISVDMDGDGDEDLVLGNQGLNNQFHASEKEPIETCYKDFDNNGSVDPVLCYYIEGKSYPAFSRDDITDQLPFLKKKYLFYSAYANATLEDMFSPQQKENMQKLLAVMLESVWLRNKGDYFELMKLPIETQYAPVHAITVGDFNKDGYNDLVMAGNNNHTRIKFSRHDASQGIMLMGNGKGNFNYLPQYISGLKLNGEARSVININNRLIFGMNNNKTVVYKIK